MVIVHRIWHPSWWVLSKALIFTAAIWFSYLVFSYEEGKFLSIIPKHSTSYHGIVPNISRIRDISAVDIF